MPEDDGGLNMPTTTDFMMDQIKQMSAMHSDIRELMTTVKHFDDNLKEIKVMVVEARSQAEAANKSADQAHNYLSNHEEDIEEIKSEIKEMKQEQKTQKDQAEKERKANRWKFWGIVVPAALAILNILIT